MKSKISLPSLLFSQTQVVFTDNAAKFTLMAMVPLALANDKQTVGWVVSLIPALLVLPFILFAPVVGWLSDRFPKRNVLNYDLLFQVVGLVVLGLSFYQRNVYLSLFAFFLLAIQACIFSPAKQGILKELVGSEKLGMAVGCMEMLTISAILGGTYFGGTFFDRWTKQSGDVWQGALVTTYVLIATSVVSVLVFQGVQQTESKSNEGFSTGLLFRHFVHLGDLWRVKPLRLAALGTAYFYSLGGALYLALIQLGREMHEGKVGSAGEAGSMLVILGVGIVSGSLIAAFLSRKRIELGLVPVGGVGMSVMILLLGLSPAKSNLFYSALIFLGVFGGMFTVPLNAFLQDRAGEEQRGRILSAANLMTNIGGVIAVGVYYILGQVLQLNASHQFLVFLIPSVLVALYVIWLLPESLLRLSILIVARCLYRVRSKGVENLPKGGALLICNHVSYVDALILQVACPRPIRFIAFEAFHKNIWIGWALKILGVIPISPRHAKDAIRHTAEKLKEGELVCVFPEGELTRTGTLNTIRKGFELMARAAEVPVVPVHLDSLWGSIFSFSEQRYVWKKPQKWPYPAFVNFGKPISHEVVNSVIARQVLMDEGEESFQKRPELSGNLGRASFFSMCKRPWEEFIVDFVPKRKALSRGMVLALAITLSRKWKKTIPEKRVGIVLPPGIGGTVANLALVILGKIPVNLNFTAGRAAMESCLTRAEIKTIITAGALKSKFPDFPWPEHSIDIAEELKSCSKGSILSWFAAIVAVPSSVLASILQVPTQGDNEEAGLLFTSGSSGDPKGVMLSHRNIIGNVEQIAAMGLLLPGDSVLACLPLFHSFGFTVTLWYPILQKGRVIAVPSPLEIKKIASAIKEEKATVLLGTPTFLRPYLKKVDAADLQTLRLIVTGAEKLPKDLAEAFEAKFGKKILEGYGLTETSPVASVNLPDPPITTRTAAAQPGNKAGSVGRLIPGMTARIRDPETGTEKSLTETGMLYLKGPNIFKGYLHDDEKTKQVVKNGWFVTGDLARFDEDGFLIIEGRISRFSKIGGEMVPHGTVEQKIIQLFGLDGADSQPLVVTGVPDESKGEALVLLTTVDLTTEMLREKLGAAGVPNLWMPKVIKRIEKIPTLPTGKLDLKGCETIAKQG